MSNLEYWRKSRNIWWRYAELVPISFVDKIRNPSPSPTTNLADGTIVNMDELWLDILKNGVKDPVILRAGIVNRTMRLDVGNHRVKILAENGIKVIPAICIVAPDCIGEIGNGHHRFPAISQLNLKNLPADAPKMAKPSEVFTKLRGFCRPFDDRTPFDVKPYLTMKY